MEMKWWTMRVMVLHKKLTALREKREEIFSYVAYPKPMEMKKAVVQTSGASGDEVLDYIIQAEEIDAQILVIAEELEGLQEYLNVFLPELTEREQRVMKLRFYDFMAWPMIAKEVYGEISDASIDKVRKAKKNALKKLSAILEN